MNRRLVFVIVAGLAPSGCCLNGSGCDVQPPTTALAAYWEELGALPKRNKVKRARQAPTTIAAVASEDKSPSEEELSKLKPYSKEWTAVLDAINRAEDAKLKKKLVICRGCMSPEPEDQTGSFAPQRAAGLPGNNVMGPPLGNMMIEIYRLDGDISGSDTDLEASNDR